MQQYQYTPLGEGKKIRLATLLPRTKSAQVHIFLTTKLLTEEDIPEYEALSYTWGSSGFRTNILVGRSRLSTLSITRNLAIALRYLRYRDRPRVLWVDALCINQQDLGERSAQVQRMADIYSRASRVVIWLGPESHDSSMALDCIELIGRHVSCDRDSAKLHALSAEAHWALMDYELPFSNTQRVSISTLFDRPWFKRLWIWQEIHLASHEKLVMVGTRTLSWDLLCTAVYCFMTKYRPWDEFRVNLWLPVFSVSQLCAKSMQLSLQGLIRYTSQSLCSDPRDKIFALLSLLPPEEKELGIIPNYAESIAKVYKDAMIRWTKKMGNLALLKDAEMSGKLGRMPSWVPDWSTERVTIPISDPHASPRFSKVYVLLEEQVLGTNGISVATINFVDRYELTDYASPSGPNYGFGHNIRRLACMPQFQDLARCEEVRLSIIFRMLASISFQDFSEDFRVLGKALLEKLRGHEQTLQRCIKALRLGDEKNLRRPERSFYMGADASCLTRRIFRTKEGHIGLAPSTAAVGDRVAVLINCPSAMILRPKRDGTFQVVGEIYLHGFMDCEAFLGPTPSSLHRTCHRTGDNCHTYVDTASGGIYVEDPRLGPLPPAWTRETHSGGVLYTNYVDADTIEKLDSIGQVFYPTFVNKETGEKLTGGADPRISIEAFQARGVEFRSFHLI